jgi:hypothetical protein
MWDTATDRAMKSIMFVLFRDLISPGMSWDLCCTVPGDPPLKQLQVDDD